MSTSSTTLSPLGTEDYFDVLQARCSCDYVSTVQQIRSALLAEVSSARARLLSTPHAPPSPPSSSTTSPSLTPGTGTFTPATLDLLESAFELTHHISRAEKAELARVTGLTERQLATWVSVGFLCSRVRG